MKTNLSADNEGPRLTNGPDAAANLCALWREDGTRFSDVFNAVLWSMVALNATRRTAFTPPLSAVVGGTEFADAALALVGALTKFDAQVEKAATLLRAEGYDGDAAPWLELSRSEAGIEQLRDIFRRRFGEWQELNFPSNS